MASTSHVLRLGGRLPLSISTPIRCRIRVDHLVTGHSYSLVRLYTISSARWSSQSSDSTSPVPRNPRWLSEARSRLGKCILFGLSGAQIQTAGHIAGVLGAEWMGLIAGVEGFAVSPASERTSYEDDSSGVWPTGWREKVVWGVQDPMVSQTPSRKTRCVCIALLTWSRASKHETWRNPASLTEYSGHVNNVNYIRYAESSRIWYFRRLGQHVPAAHKQEWDQLMSPRGIGLILKSISVDFLFPLQYPDSISVYHRLAASESSGSSLVLKSSIISHKHQRSAARIVEDIVVYDYRLGKKAVIPNWMKAVLRTAETQERESGLHWNARREEIDRRLKQLETDTIFSGKEEDMGSAA